MKDKIIKILGDDMSDELSASYIIYEINNMILDKLAELVKKGQTAGYTEIQSLYINR